ncbi:hypothetical protein [Marinobacter sp. LQ44]|uniref:hypothetical protein n=1 Tax=unclassified Marinobacter TaxID=83889 RepID=UPI000718DEDE|nr:hypothetical protein [Marinobacter sp. LQ44]AMQ87950.1 hypothetical protein ASQ50_04240 [Marinobacter sp. LQ44]
MLHTVEAVINEKGHIEWLEKVSIKGARRVLITLLDEVDPQDEVLAAAESALAEDWLKDDEEKAWEHLKKEV